MSPAGTASSIPTRAISSRTSVNSCSMRGWMISASSSGVDRVIDRFGETTDVSRAADPHGHLEGPLGHLRGAVELRAPSGEDEPRRDGFFHPDPGDLLTDECEQLLYARLDDLGQ